MAELHTLSQALETLLEGVSPVERETVALESACGRVLAEPIVALRDAPPFDASAMDGYALRAADAGRRLPVAQRIAAGAAPAPLAPGSCARIFTGAQLPPGADCVVMQEQVKVADGSAEIPAGLETGTNVRRRGRELAAGETLLQVGHWLDAAAVGMIASQGHARVAVRRRPRVALLATGDELTAPGEPLAQGRIYDSNRYMLGALLPRFGFEVIHSQRVADRFEATADALGAAAQHADVVVTSGGVSVGEEDHVRAAVESRGRLSLWRLDIRPGKPLALGRLPRKAGGEACFVGLAGNPVSSFVGAWLFLRPLAAALLGAPALAALPRLRACAQFSERTSGRWHYMRVKLDHQRQDGVACAFSYPDQDSSLLRSCIDADALAVIPPNAEIHPGAMIDCLLLR